VGLGHDFLRHIDRCRLLIHVVDVSGCEGRDPVADFDAINAELAQYSPELATRPQIVAANKMDIMEHSENLEALRAHVEAKGYTLFEMSAAAHLGTRELMLKTTELLSSLPPVTVYEPEYVKQPPVVDTTTPLLIEQTEDGTWVVEGPWLQRLMGNINFEDQESRMYFDKTLRESGLFERMEEMGVKDGDAVTLYNYEFDYQK
ncbi:MAG: Obg family GTPase CgtA, partial [Oscillibacter sp.]